MSNHEKFRKALYESMLDVYAVVGAYVRHPDYDILMPEFRIAADQNTAFSKSDAGDLKVRKKGGPWEIIEVKGYKYALEQMERFENIIVDRKESYDRKDHVPDFYYAVPRGRHWGLWHDHKTNAHNLLVKTFKHQITGNEDECYVLPQHHWNKVEL